MTYEWIGTDILQYLKKYEVNYIEWEDWETRARYGPDLRDFTPIGLINHHTAGTDYYNPERLLTKCNFYVSPDGVTFILSAGYQADSGYGDPTVVERMVDDGPILPPTDTVHSQRINGNPFFVDIEVGHWGMGEPIPVIQRDELIRLNAAICDYYEWDPNTRLIGHKEWTRRKVDPRWSFNGEPDKMEYIRRDTVEMMESKEYGMPYEQFVNLIDTLFAVDPEFNGDPSYFYRRAKDGGIYDVPDAPDWRNFWNAFARMVQN